jgi:hypothetical protein
VLDFVDLVEIRKSGRASHCLVKHRHCELVVNRPSA